MKGFCKLFAKSQGRNVTRVIYKKSSTYDVVTWCLGDLAMPRLGELI